MSRTIEMVGEFHEAFDIADPDRPTTPDLKPAERRALEVSARFMEFEANGLRRLAKLHNSALALRISLCQEELAELVRAIIAGDMVECLDALCDMRYVADGTALTLGLGEVFDEAMTEVHRSNMSKLVDGKVVKDDSGKVLKPETFSRPKLSPILRDGGW